MPASGDVVLVVTPPAVAASKAAAYTVTCGPPATPAGRRCHNAGGYRRPRETLGEPECHESDADVRHDVADAGPDHQQPGADSHDQQPDPGADHPDTDDGNPHAYASDYPRDAAADADAACPAHDVTRKHLSGHRPHATQQRVPAYGAVTSASVRMYG